MFVVHFMDLYRWLQSSKYTTNMEYHNLSFPRIDKNIINVNNGKMAEWIKNVIHNVLKLTWFANAGYLASDKDWVSS